MSQDHGAAFPLQDSLHTQTTTAAVGRFIPVLKMNVCNDQKYAHKNYLGHYIHLHMYAITITTIIWTTNKQSTLT